MGFFSELFGGEPKPETPEEQAPQEEKKSEGLSEEKEQDWFEKGEEKPAAPETSGEETEKMTEEREEDWFKEGEERSKQREVETPEQK